MQLGDLDCWDRAGPQVNQAGWCRTRIDAPDSFSPSFTGFIVRRVRHSVDEVQSLLELWGNAVDSMRMNVRSDVSEDPLQAAITRLDGAMSRVEGLAGHLRARAERAELEAAQSRDADDDRSRLAAALDEAQGREAALHQAAQEASDALDRAIGDLRLMMQEEAE